MSYTAAEWLSWELADAQRKVSDAELDLHNKEWAFRISQGHLAQAVAHVEIIQQLISGSGLEGSANPADITKEA